jgi:hypothetical protein
MRETNADAECFPCAGCGNPLGSGDWYERGVATQSARGDVCAGCAKEYAKAGDEAAATWLVKRDGRVARRAETKARSRAAAASPPPAAPTLRERLMLSGAKSIL